MSQNWLKYSWEYRPSAFYFWNEDMDEERIESMLSKMEADCIRECLFHPVHGLTQEYLSEEYCKIFRTALKLAKKHNIKVWIYDEYSWPSGCVGGKLLREHPEYNGWYLSFENNTAKPKPCKRLHDGTTGAPWTKGEIGYIDTLNNEAVQCFINMNYEKLKEISGEFWEDTVIGFFTDEPATMMPGTKGSFWEEKALPWTEKLPQIFKEINGYDIEPYYNDLFKDEHSELKEDYFKTVKYLHSNAYHRQISEWCKKNRKEYTGHTGEDYLTMQVNFGGSLYENLSNMTRPGVDFLNLNDPDMKIDQEIVASIAKHSSESTAKKVYCEAFGISRYTLCLEELYNKWTGLSVQRVNDIALMGMQHSTSGIRKRTYFPPFTEDEPWWDYYPQFRDSVARAMGLSNLGKDIRTYAILYPQYETQQHAYDFSYNNIIHKKVSDETEYIEKSQNQYDWIFPEILPKAKTENGKIIFPNETYDGIIAFDTIDYSETEKKILKSLEEKGAKIIRNSKETLNLPIWNNIINIQSDGKTRFYTYEYEDGYIIAIRNISENKSIINAEMKDCDYKLCQWLPYENKIYKINYFNETLNPHTNIYLSVTKENISDETKPKLKGKTINSEFILKAETYNTAPFNSVRAKHKTKGYINLTLIPLNETFYCNIFGKCDGLNANGFPLLTEDFFGYENIEFECDFYMEDLCPIGIIGEKKYIKDIEINGNIAKCQSKDLFLWDFANVYFDLSDYVKLGKNTIKFTLGFQSWETSVRNDAFFSFKPMPSADVCLAGDFLFKNNKIYKYSNIKQKLPIDLSEEGFANTYGSTVLEGEFEKTEDMDFIFADFSGNSAIEILIDNVSLGAKIINAPYLLKHIPNGKHNIKIILTGTSASLMDCKEINQWKIFDVIY